MVSFSQFIENIIFLGQTRIKCVLIISNDFQLSDLVSWANRPISFSISAFLYRKIIHISDFGKTVMKFPHKEFLTLKQFARIQMNNMRN